MVDAKGNERVVWEGGYNTNAACVGGGTLSYGAMAWRKIPRFHDEVDTGAIKDSTLDDWPVTYDDLEPYYEQAEWEIGVSGGRLEQPVQGHAEKAAADAARGSAVERAPRPGRGGAENRTAPFRHPDAAQFGSVQRRPACVRPRWCRFRLRGGRQVRHAAPE